MHHRDHPARIDAELRHLARPQLGLVTLRQIEQVGIDHSAVTRRRASGALDEVFAGVLRLGAVPTTPEQRTLAAALAVPGSVVAASSAALVCGLPVESSSAPIVAVGRSRSARTAGIAVVRSQLVLPSRPWYTVRAATPEAALVLLPRFETEAVVEECLDHCLAHRLTTVGRVRHLVESLPPRAVVGRSLLLTLLAARTSGIGHRSGLERRVGRWLVGEGLGGFTRNLRVAIVGGEPIEVDFAWPDAKVALEVSPFFTHGSEAAQRRDVERRRVLAAEQWRTIEATDPDLVDEAAFRRCAGLIRRALVAASAATSGALQVAERPGTHPTPRRVA